MKNSTFFPDYEILKNENPLKEGLNAPILGILFADYV